MIEGIAYEGGGALGVAYVGAIRALEHHVGADWDVNLEVVSGTSAGAIMGAVTAAKPSYRTVKRIMTSIPWNLFQQDTSGYFMDVLRLLRTGGYHKTDGIPQWIESLVFELYGNTKVTFSQIESEKGVQLFIDAVDEGTGQLVRFGPQTHPDTKVAEAIMASISIPFWFPAVAMNGTLMSDGGLLSNHPVDALEAAGKPPESVLGFRLEGEAKTKQKPSRNPIQRAINLVKITMNHARKSHVPDEYWPRIVRIHTGRYSAVDFKLSEVEQAALEGAGWLATTQWLTRNHV